MNKVSPIHYVAPVTLALHGALFSTPHFALAAAASCAIGLIMASRNTEFGRQSLLFVWAPLFAGAGISLIHGSAPGPSAEIFAIICGGCAWWSIGAHDENRVAGEKIFGSLALVTALAATGELLLGLESRARLWMISPIDLGLFILIFGIAGRNLFTGMKGWMYDAVILLGLVSTLSRAIVIGGLVGLIYLRRSRAILVVATMILAVAAPLIMARVGSDPLAWQRTRIFMAAINLILERPLLGWGFGSFDAVSWRAAFPDPIDVRNFRGAVHAHSEPLELIFEIGLPLALLFFSGAIWVCGNLRLHGRRQALALVLALIPAAAFYFPFRLVFPFFALCFFAGGSETSVLRIRPLRVIFAGLALVVPLYGIGIFLRNPALAPFNAFVALQANPDLPGIERMVELEPERAEGWRNLAIHRGRAGDTAAAIAAMDVYVGKQPRYPTARIELARACYWATGLSSDAVRADLEEKARDQIRFVGVLEPLFLEIYRMRGDEIGYRIAQKRLDRMRETQKRETLDALEAPVLPNYPSAGP